jgi:hypothetical protein
MSDKKLKLIDEVVVDGPFIIYIRKFDKHGETKYERDED